VNAGGVQATAQADAQMTGLLGRLFAVAEAYPELKANQNFLQLQDQLSGIEGELQGARRYYNATVRDLNSTIQSFPPTLIARPMGFTEEPFYQDDDPAIQSAPKVSFTRPAA
jgi:LemA protein